MAVMIIELIIAGFFLAAAAGVVIAFRMDHGVSGQTRTRDDRGNDDTQPITTIR